MQEADPQNGSKADLHRTPEHERVMAVLSRMSDVSLTYAEWTSNCEILADLAGGDTFESKNPEYILLIMRFGGLEVISRGMNSFAYCAPLQASACKAVWRLSRSGEHRRMIASKLLSPVLAAMRMHCDDRDVQDFACGCLLNLSPDPSNKVLIAEQAVEDILMALRTHHQHPRLLEKACALLKNLSPELARSQALAESWVLDLIAVMRKHKGNEVVGALVCGILFNLSWNGASSRLIGDRGLTALVAAMEMHGSERMQEAGLKLLWVLGFQAQNKLLLLQGGLRLVLSAMDRFLFHPTMQVNFPLASLFQHPMDGLTCRRSKSSARRLCGSEVVLWWVALYLREMDPGGGRCDSLVDRQLKRRMPATFLQLAWLLSEGRV